MTADQDVLNQGAGGPPGGPAFPEALAAMLYDANLFGLSVDYAYTEGSNVTAARWSQITTLTKLLTRTHTHVDGNRYDAWDCLQTIVKYILTVAPDINAGEKNAVKRPPA